MPIATASSAYVLEDRASPALRSIREEANRTTVALKATGKALDGIGSPAQLARLDRLERRFGNLAGSSERMQSRIDTAMRHMQGSVRTNTLKAEARVDALGAKFDELGRKRVSPRVELDGYAEVRAQVASLQHQLDQFGRTSASARVRAIPGLAGGGGVGVARSGGFIGTQGAGIFTSRRGLIAGGLLAALPAAQLLGGAALGLTGSLAGGALAAGAGGAAGGGALAAGIAGISSVIIPARKELKALTKAHDAYTKAVQRYGAASKQAKQAQVDYNRTLRAAPRGAAEFQAERAALSRRWQSLTRGSQGDLLGLGSFALGRVRGASPQLAGDVRTVTRATRSSGEDLARYLTGPQNLRLMGDLSKGFADNIGEAERTAEHLIGTFGNIARASMPFFHDGMVFVDHWTGGWEKSTHNVEATRRTIGGYVHDLQSWAHLLGAAFEVVRDFTMPGRSQGRSLVDDLTGQLHEWDRWAQTNPGRLKRFFDESTTGTKQLAGTLGTITHDLHEMATLLTPILSRFAALAQIAGGAGLLLPTAIRWGLGRALGRTGGGTGAAGGPGGAPLVIAGGGGARTTTSNSARLSGQSLAFQRVYGALPDAAYGAPRSALGRRGIVGGLGRGARALAPAALTAGRFVAPIFAVQAALGAAQDPGGAGLMGRYRNLTSAVSLGLVDDQATVNDRATRRDLRGFEGYLRRQGAPNTYGRARRQLGNLRGVRARTIALADQRGVSGDERDALVGAIDREIQARRDLLPTLRQERDARSRDRGEVRGQSAARAFRSDVRHFGPERAFRELRSNLLGAGGIPARQFPGARQLAEGGLQAAREAAKNNPKLQREYDKLEAGVRRKFDKMGRHVVTVNGQILAASEKDWPRIRDKISDPAEQARERVSKAFSAIQQAAIGSLEDMGYSRGQARAIVRGAAGKGTSSINAAASAATGATDTTAGTRSRLQNQAFGPAPGIAGPLGARGMRIPGYGLRDTVPVAGIAAPGELIVNRHTERDHDRDARRAGLPTLGQRVARETRGHSSPLGAPSGVGIFGGIMPGLQTGGRLAAQDRLQQRFDRQTIGVASRHPQGSEGPGRQVAGDLGAMIAAAQRIAAARYPYRWGGGHDLNFTPPYDCSGAVSTVLHAGGVLSSPLTSGAMQSIGRPGAGAVTLFARPSHVFMSLNGRGWGTGSANSGGGAGWLPYASRPGFTVRHIPVGGDVGGAFSMGELGGLAVPHVSLRSPRSGVRGVGGVIADTAMGGMTRGLERKVNARLDALGGPAGAIGGGGSSAAKRYARSRFANYGWGADQWGPLDALWTRESGWDPNAVNPTSGAAGIAQSLGHGAVPLGDYRSQVNWGEGYIHERYGTPAAAWAHEQSAGWYRRGGRIPWYGRGVRGVARRPTVIGVGDHPRGEDISVSPRRLGPPTRASRTGGGRSLASVIIERMIVHYAAPGDMKSTVKRELREAIRELTAELDDGVNADEMALLR